MPSLIKGIRRQFAAAGLGLMLGVQFAHAGNDDVTPGDGDNAAAQPNADLMETADGRAIPHPGGRQAAMHAAMDDAFDMAALGIDMRINHPVVGGLYYRKRAEEKYQAAVDKVMAELDTGMDGAATDPETGTPYFIYAIRLAYEARRPELIEEFLENGVDPDMRIDESTPFLAMPSREEIEDADKRDFQLPHSVMDLAVLQFLKGQYHSRTHTDAALEMILMLERAGASLDDIEAGADYIDGDVSSYKDFAQNLVGWRALAARDMATSDELAEAEQMPGLDKAEAATDSAAPDKAFLAGKGAEFADYDHLYPGQGTVAYTAQADDTLWDIAGRFQPMMGADNRQDALDALKSANDSGARGADHIKAGAQITIPVAADKRSVYADYNSLSVLYGVAAEIRSKLEITGEYLDDLPTLKQIVTILIRDNNDRLAAAWDAADQRIIEPLRPGQTLSFHMPWLDYEMQGGKHHTIKITKAHAIDGLVHQLHSQIAPAYNGDSTALIAATRARLQAYNDIDLTAAKAGEDELTPGRRFWAHVPATLSDHVPELTVPETADNGHDAYMAVIEDSQEYHHKNTYKIAAHTMAGVNTDSDPSRIMAWRAYLPSTFLDAQDKSPALQMTLNKGATDIDDSIVFSYSAALQVDYETATTEAQARLPDNSNYVLMETYLDDLYANAPVVIRGSGNARQSNGDRNTGPSSTGMGRFATSDILAYSPRTVAVGAVDENREHAPDGEEVIRDYANYGGAICLGLPEEKGVTMEGTSYATPTFAALTRQMMDWYGHRLDFEEVFAAAAMATSQGIRDFDPFGGAFENTIEGDRAVPAEFVTNGAGMAYHGRCGFGHLGQDGIRRWNNLLQDMIAWKQARDLDAGTVNRQLTIGEADYVAAGTENEGPEYVYTVEIPVDMTLDKLSLLLPQERFNRSGVIVESPSGFDYRLPETMNQASYTRAFSYEDVTAGEKLTIRTQAPLADGAQVYLYGHEDGNVIQAAREKLRREGGLYPPLHRLESDKVAGRMDAGRARRMANIHPSAAPQ